MTTKTIEPATASRVVEQVLGAFHEVRELADLPRFGDQLDRVRLLLQSAVDAMAEVHALSPYKPDGKETTCSREWVGMSMGQEIARLAELKVALALKATRGDELDVDPFRVFVAAAVAARSILVCPPFTPRKEVSVDAQGDPAQAFRDG